MTIYILELLTPHTSVKNLECDNPVCYFMYKFRHGLEPKFLPGWYIQRRESKLEGASMLNFMGRNTF